MAVHLYRSGRRLYRSRVWFYASAVGVAGLVLLVVVMASSGSQSASVAPPAAAAPTDTATTLPIVGPHVPWVMVGGLNGVAVPDGGTRYGPTVKDPIHGLFSGYARTPLGALVAAVDLATRTIVGTEWRPPSEQQVTGPGRDAWLALRGTVGNDPPPEGFCQTAGFQFVSWTPDVASIGIASACPSGGLQAEVISVEWHGDWQLVRVADGGVSAAVEPLTSMDGFTSWGAQ